MLYRTAKSRVRPRPAELPRLQAHTCIPPLLGCRGPPGGICGTPTTPSRRWLTRTAVKRACSPAPHRRPAPQEPPANSCCVGPPTVQEEYADASTLRDRLLALVLQLRHAKAEGRSRISSAFQPLASALQPAGSSLQHLSHRLGSAPRSGSLPCIQEEAEEEEEGRSASPCAHPQPYGSGSLQQLADACALRCEPALGETPAEPPLPPSPGAPAEGGAEWEGEALAAAASWPGDAAVCYGKGTTAPQVRQGAPSPPAHLCPSCNPLRQCDVACCCTWHLHLVLGGRL